jgi:hypothetical protein
MLTAKNAMRIEDKKGAKGLKCKFGCPFSCAKPLSPVKAGNSAAYRKEEPP